MKRILLSLIVAAPICAMQPEKKFDVQTNARRVATGISMYNALKPIELVPCIMPNPSLWPFVTPFVVYGATQVAIEMYKKSLIQEESKK